MPNLTSGDYWRVLAIELLFHNPIERKKASQRCLKSQERDFREDFGCHWDTCADIWNLLHHPTDSIDVAGKKPKHLLWALFFAKNYATESVNKKMVCTSPKTLRKWAWIFLQHIADLHSEVVSF